MLLKRVCCGRVRSRWWYFELGPGKCQLVSAVEGLEGVVDVGVADLESGDGEGEGEGEGEGLGMSMSPSRGRETVEDAIVPCHARYSSGYETPRRGCVGIEFTMTVAASCRRYLPAKSQLQLGGLQKHTHGFAPAEGLGLDEKSPL